MKQSLPLHEIDTNANTASNHAWLNSKIARSSDQLQSEFKATQVKILGLFTSAKKDLSVLYHEILIRIKKIDKILSSDRDAANEKFYSLLSKIDQELNAKSEQITETLREALIDPLLFDRLQGLLPQTASTYSQRRLSDYSSSIRKGSLKMSQTIHQIEEEVTQEQRAITVTVKPKGKITDGAYWLSGKWQTLQKISLDNKALVQVVPFSTIEAQCLRQVSLSSNAISSLSFISQAYFPNLQSINLRHNLIGSFQGLQQANLPCLKILNVSKNRIKSLGGLQEVSFPQLIELNVSENRLASVDSLTKAKFPKLQILNVDKNSIRSIDSLSSCSFPRLKILSFCHNQIGSIDFLSTSKFTRIQALMGYNNQIRSIDILQKCQLSHLKQLLLNNNLISDISVVQKLDLKKLCEFDLQNNRIEEEQFLCFSTKSSDVQKAKRKYPFIQL